MSNKITVELEYEQIDAITISQLKEARDELKRSLDANVNDKSYFRVYFNGKEDPDGSKDRVALEKMITSFGHVLEYWGER